MTDQLASGESLLAGDSLVSPSGEFRLGMQHDGNLVLYDDVSEDLLLLPVPAPGRPLFPAAPSSGPLSSLATRPRLFPAISKAYWSTDTWALPSDQRPIKTTLRSDGQLVLVDAAGAVRWGSGTWGPGVAGSTLRLQDDGNLVIMNGNDVPVWASGIPGGRGAVPPAGLVPAADSSHSTLSQHVELLGNLPPVVTERVPETVTTRSLSSSGVEYQVTEQRTRRTEEVVEHAYLTDLAALGVWPGQTIQGASLLAGDVAPIGPLARTEGTVTVVTDFIGGSSTPSQSRTLAQPTVAAVDDARRSILRAVTPSDSVGILKADVSRANTLREFGVNAGVQVKGSTFGVDANVSLTSSYKDSVVLAVIRQVFYSITFTPTAPGARGFWTPQVTVSDLDPYAGPGNPPLYIDSVQYGRLIAVMARGAFSSTDLTAAVRASVNAGVSGSLSLDVRSREIIDNSSVKIYTIGVPGKAGFQTLTNPASELETVYSSGLRYGQDNPGMPIAFTARHIANNTRAKVAVSAEWVQPLDVHGVDVNGARFFLWDGSGGGLRDTGINVNPGDSVQVSTSGRIWSGVFGSGTHGPQGWPGHRPNPAAPVPQNASAYSLILSVGGRSGSWVEAGPFYQSTMRSDQRGRLLLNINDDNPYNGDAKQRWQSIVDVRRGSAASAGIFI